MYDKTTIILSRIKLVRHRLEYDDTTAQELAKELCEIILEELEIDIEDIEEEL